MGGPGSGHKSARATQSRRVNIQKARAARKRAPLPWRSGLESRIIEQLVWQWWMTTVSGKRPAFAKASARQASGGVDVERDSQSRAGAASSVPTRAKRPWAKYRVARFLGVSHTWVNKLVKRFEADPDRMRRKMRAFAPASFEKLERAREETRRERERGWLRGPIRWRRVKVMLEGRKRTVVAVTRAERQRREAARLRQGYGASSGQALREGRVEMQRDSASRPPRRADAGKVNRAPTKASAAPVRYSELPQWASGLLPAGGTGMAIGHGPRAVPFAFRRRR